VRLLLDTVALIFAVESPERLTERATGILQNTENILELSAISLSEIAVKAARGELKFSAADTRHALETWTFAYCRTQGTMHSFFSIYRPCTRTPLTVKSSPRLYAKRSR
jgi:PIN domain nuclease of toxin-antitoxin system